MSELTKWLYEKDYFTKTKKVTVPSHLLYSGGKIYVPRDQEHDFLIKYAESLEKSKNSENQFVDTELYFVETRPLTFKFMIDLDISDDHYWTETEIESISKDIQEIVFCFFQDNKMTICCTSGPKKKDDKIHTGVHLIWPNIFVTAETALTIRHGIVQKFKEKPTIKDKPWEDVFDELIYTRNGYRMVGSDKMSPSKVPENRPLNLLFVMNSKGEKDQVYYDRLCKSTRSLMFETSIRYVLSTYLKKGMDLPKIPTWLENDTLMRIVSSKSKSSPSVVATQHEHVIIENFIKNNLPKQYIGNVVKAVTRYPDENLLIKTNSRYCLNLGREHNSCGIYFFASPQGLYQKCLCPCNKLDSRKHGYCKDFVSQCFPFNEELVKILFPKWSKKNFIVLEKKADAKKKTFKPDTKQQRLETEKDLCSKLLNDILGT